MILALIILSAYLYAVGSVVMYGAASDGGNQKLWLLALTFGWPVLVPFHLLLVFVLIIYDNVSDFFRRKFA